jgi:hypothetical protein
MLIAESRRGVDMRWFLYPLFFLLMWAGVHREQPAKAHPGGLNAEGCHHNRKTGSYHCHGGPSSAPSKARSLAQSQGREFANCSQARAAGAAPVRTGDPGFGRHLDRDGDGIGCE